MYLIVAATENEIKPLAQAGAWPDRLEFLVTGVGPFAAAVKLTRYLAANHSRLSGILNIGVGGAYPGSGLDILDICIAGQEVFGELGICMEDVIVDFDQAVLPVTKQISMEGELLSRIEKILKSNAMSYNIVNFVTVSCCSGTEQRGAYLQSRYQAACENMEGATVALACREFGVPCVEVRCISNMVEDRNLENWQLADAVDKLNSVARIVIENLISQP